MRRAGQNLVEFSIIIALVSICTILALTLLGTDIVTILGISEKKFEDFQPFGKVTASPSIPPPVVPQSPPGGVTPIPEVKNLVYNPDGSVSFKVGNQTVDIPSNVAALQNTVNQTTGASGDINNLVNEIAYMISTHKTGPGDVPIEISFGTGQRFDKGKTTAGEFAGTAEVNITTIKAGNDVVILQNDQGCYYGGDINGCCISHKNQQGSYRVEGTIANNVFNGAVTAKTAAGIDVSGTYSSPVVQSGGGIVFDKGLYAMNKQNQPYPNYDWTFNFSDPTYNFNI